MTTKEKAIELVEKYQSGYYVESGFSYQFNNDLEDAKKCGLITVDEILNYINRMNEGFNLNLSTSDWVKVKEEIEKL